LTDILKQALPSGWKVYGTDISSIAIEKAKKQFPSCAFFTTGDKSFTDRRFDFLFTHHVLEHVYDLRQVLHEMDGFLTPTSAMLHTLPCGNEGSFEHRVCLLRKDGIDSALENRFFFEDEGHVRRLTTEQLNELCARMGFALAKAYYSNQYFGAINWITLSGRNFVHTFTDTSQALDEQAQEQLRRLRYMLWGIWVLRHPVAVVERRLRKSSRTLRDFAYLALGLPMYLVAKPLDIFLRRKAREEWRTRKTDPHGSEMYLFFKRESVSFPLR
jgi:trans-aconitate methyltransferase